MAKWDSVLEELVTTRHGQLVAYATMLTGSRADAEDLVQDALISSFSKARAFPNAFAAEGYVRRAIASKFIDGRRRHKVEQRVFRRMGSQDVDPAAGPDVTVEHASDVAQALAQLSPRQRACVVLRFLEHQSVAETSAVLGISEGAVKRYVSEAVSRLNGLLGTNDDGAAADWAAVGTGRVR